MNKSMNNPLPTRPRPLPAERFSRSRAGGRGRLFSALPAQELPPWAAAAPPDDTLTEMEGLARNPNAAGAYAGSF